MMYPRALIKPRSLRQAASPGQTQTSYHPEEGAWFLFCAPPAALNPVAPNAAEARTLAPGMGDDDYGEDDFEDYEGARCRSHPCCFPLASPYLCG